MHTTPRPVSPNASGRGLNRAPRHPDTPAAINPAPLAQPGPHRASYGTLEDVDRLQAARRFAVLHAHALDAGLDSDAAATAAIAWLARGAYGHGPRGHAPAPVALVRGEGGGGLDRTRGGRGGMMVGLTTDSGDGARVASRSNKPKIAGFDSRPRNQARRGARAGARIP